MWKKHDYFHLEKCRQTRNSTASIYVNDTVIVLIPKPKKGSLYLDNWRPITLLATDNKLLAHVYANRRKQGLDDIISETQSAFIKGRSIHNCILLVLDIFDYSELMEDDGFMLFLDSF
jgi:hypothetical protein